MKASLLGRTLVPVYACLSLHPIYRVLALRYEPRNNACCSFPRSINYSTGSPSRTAVLAFAQKEVVE